VVLEPVLVAVSDRRFLRPEIDPHLSIRIALAIPAGQRIRPERLLPLELQDPATGIRISRLGSLALKLGDAGDGHRGRKWQSVASESSGTLMRDWVCCDRLRAFQIDGGDQ
jgi:hypothetical protein